MEVNFTKKEIINALKEIDSDPDLQKIKEDSKYELEYEGKQYLPILVLSIAQELKDGSSFNLSNFGSNPEAPIDFFRNQGFDIIPKITNNKSDYKKWAKSNLKIKDSTKDQYLSSIEYLSKIVGYNIFEIDDREKITDLYEDLREKQTDKNEKYYDEQRPSYSLKGWYSASVKTYLEYLESKPIITLVSHTRITSFNTQVFTTSVTNCGLNFNTKFITRFISSLITKPFVILTGLAGSGKTKIAQSFIQWICSNKDQYILVAVGADWINREPLLGYPNGLNTNEYVTPDNGVLELMIRASKPENKHKPHFILLDEMNLSHVERYFADFLSVMESADTIKLYTGQPRKSSNGSEIPLEISWPANLFIIGTVNIDETTYMFSPKVLDRANVIEFRLDDTDLLNFLRNPKKADLSQLLAKGASMGHDFVNLANTTKTEPEVTLNNTLVEFFRALKPVGAEFGYRTAFEIHLLYTQLGVIDSTLSAEDKTDFAIVQKLLPKLHGSRSKIVKHLETLMKLCVKSSVAFNLDKLKEVRDEDIKYKVSFEKLKRMYDNALSNGFTSYAEA